MCSITFPAAPPQHPCAVRGSWATAGPVATALHTSGSMSPGSNLPEWKADRRERLDAFQMFLVYSDLAVYGGASRGSRGLSRRTGGCEQGRQLCVLVLCWWHWCCAGGTGALQGALPAAPALPTTPHPAISSTAEESPPLELPSPCQALSSSSFSHFPLHYHTPLPPLTAALSQTQLPFPAHPPFSSSSGVSTSKGST